MTFCTFYIVQVTVLSKLQHVTAASCNPVFICMTVACLGGSRHHKKLLWCFCGSGRTEHLSVESLAVWDYFTDTLRGARLPVQSDTNNLLHLPDRRIHYIERTEVALLGMLSNYTF